MESMCKLLFLSFKIKVSTSIDIGSEILVTTAAINQPVTEKRDINDTENMHIFKSMLDSAHGEGG